MNATPPGMFKAIHIQARFAIRRRLNQLQGNLNVAFGKKKSAADDTKRTGTARKGRAGGVLLLFLGAIFLFNGVNMSSQFIRRLSERIDFKENMILGENAHEKLFETARMLKMADTLPARSPSGIASRKEWESYLRQSFILDSVLRGMPKEQQEARADELMRVFKEKGTDGFRLKKIRVAIFFPSVDSWTLPENQALMLRALGAVWLLLGIALLFMIAGNMSQDLGKVEWGMEWLFTFPISARSLFLARLCEFALVNPAVWFCSLPFSFVVFWCAGFEWWAVGISLLTTLYMAILLASVHVVAEVWLRKVFAANMLKNIQAVMTLTGTLFFLSLIWLFIAPSSGPYLEAAAAGLPHFLAWSPISVPALLAEPSYAMKAIAVMLISVVSVPLVAVRWCEYLTRGGLTGSSAAYTGTRGKSEAAQAGGGWLTGIVGKEVRLLFRDRNFLVQTLVVPVLGIGFQVLMSPDLLKGAAGDLRHASTMAFALGAYVLMFSAFQVLTVEGQGLWMLYTFPQDVSTILLKKTVLWCGFGLFYTAAVLVICVAINPALKWAAISPAVTALAGVVIYAYIASGIGVLGTDPLEVEAQRKVRPEMMYLYMLLVTLFAYAIYSVSVWSKLAQLVLSALLAYALWQKVRDRAPYMLDPTQEPPPDISLADGMIAALAFFVLQGLIGLLLMQTGLPVGAQLLIAFVSAGLIVALLTLYVFWRKQVPNILAAVGFRGAAWERLSVLRAFLWGLLAGLAAASFAVVYLWCVTWIEPLRELKEESVKQALQWDASFYWWLAGLAVVAGPLFEEYIFRGLVYRGLRRSVQLYVAVLASAGVFAIVHPPLSVIPVFALGVVAAISFEKTRLLLAPIVAHMVYNGILVAMQ